MVAPAQVHERFEAPAEMAPSDGSSSGCGVPPQHNPSIARSAAILELLASLGPSSMACIVGAVSAVRMVCNVRRCPLRTRRMGRSHAH